jgi:MoaA/NifB/PqqE/SkfB family radical SAM enzyme
MGTMDRRRWENILRLDRDYAAGEQLIASRPIEAYIEVAARCNLRCVMCPITVDPRYQSGSATARPPLLSEELFERLAPIFPTLRRVHLFGLGEPMLHPKFLDFTARLAAAGVEVWTTTNATLIDQEKADGLAKAGLARVSVSIDGGTRETYERIRVRGKWRDVLRGLQALGSARRRFGRPRFYFNVVAMASNLQELPELIQLCAEVGGDGVSLEGLYPYEHPTIEAFVEREHLSHLGRERVEELLEAARLRAEELGVEWWTRLEEQATNAVKADGLPLAAVPEVPDSVRQGTEGLAAAGASSVAAAQPELVMPWACSEPWVAINVDSAGEIRPCCFNDTVLGRLSEHTIEEIWNGSAYASLRSDMVAGRVPDACATCVSEGRVKCNDFLMPAQKPRRAESPVVLESPRDGELISGSLVVVGRLTNGRSIAPARMAGLPELYLDDTRVASLSRDALFDGEAFTVLVPLEFASVGSHVLSLRLPGAERAGSWGQIRLQVGGLESGHDPALGQISTVFDLAHREPMPRLEIDGNSHPVARWICGERGDRWIGVALVRTDELDPGAHELEWRFERHPITRRSVERLDLEVAALSGPSGR